MISSLGLSFKFEIGWHKDIQLLITEMFLPDHLQEQEMEIEALEAILMDEFQG